MDAFLIVDTQVYPIRRSSITLGRHLENDVVLQNATISRQHAQINKHDDGRFIIRDLGSTGGTYVNGSRVDECVLHSGDSIVLAGTAIVFVQNAPTLAKLAKDETGPLLAPGRDESHTIKEDKFIWRGDDPLDDENLETHQ
jgi:pSer/pThr/pTyr-binding forkhead associated (FHA) protein